MIGLAQRMSSSQLAKKITTMGRLRVIDSKFVFSQPYVYEAMAQQQQTHAHRFEMLDDVFGQFLSTNIHCGRRYTFDELLAISGKKYFRYEHYGTPFVATVKMVSHFKGPMVVIKLANDGFYFAEMAGKHVQRHRSYHWIHLQPHKLLQHFGKLLDKADGLFASVSTWYNYQEQRVDILCNPTAENGTRLRVTFERGSRYVDDDYPATPISSIRL